MARRNRHDNQREDRTSSYDPEYDLSGQEEDDDEDVFAEGSFGYGSSSGRSSVRRSSADRSSGRNSLFLSCGGFNRNRTQDSVNFFSAIFCKDGK